MTTTGVYTCPWCEQPVGEERDLRFHLMANHRKSELAGFVVEALEDGSGSDDPVPAEGRRNPAVV